MTKIRRNVYSSLLLKNKEIGRGGNDTIERMMAVLQFGSSNVERVHF